MDEILTIYDLKTLEKNYGLTPADCLIIEIQKPKMPSSLKYQIEIQKSNQKNITQDHLKYKDPKVSIK